MINFLIDTWQKVDKTQRRRIVVGLFEVVIIFVLLAIVIFRKPEVIPIIKDNEKVYRDSIQALQKQYNTIQINITRLNKSYDSLQTSKANVQTIYVTKIKYIDRASTNSLDSLIRHNW